MYNVYVPKTGLTSDWQPVANMFSNRGWNVFTSLNSNPMLDLICFTGGSDVSPSYYGEENTASVCDLDRDVHEVGIYLAFESLPKVGICRGGQLLNIINGGKMIQHLGQTVSGDVIMETHVGADLPLKETVVRVDHHQGIIAHSDAEVSGFIRLDDVEKVADYIVWYEETKSLCFQPHPEWGHEGTEELFFNLIKEKFNYG